MSTILFPGDELRRRREELDLTFADVRERLHIREAIVRALEEGELQHMPEPAYAIGFIRSYCTLLGLDANRFVDSYKAYFQPVGKRGAFRRRAVDDRGGLSAEIKSWAAVCAVVVLLWAAYMLVVAPPSPSDGAGVEAGTEELLLPDVFTNGETELP